MSQYWFSSKPFPGLQNDPGTLTTVFYEPRPSDSKMSRRKAKRLQCNSQMRYKKEISEQSPERPINGEGGGKVYHIQSWIVHYRSCFITCFRIIVWQALIIQRYNIALQRVIAQLGTPRKRALEGFNWPALAGYKAYCNNTTQSKI